MFFYSMSLEIRLFSFFSYFVLKSLFAGKESLYYGLCFPTQDKHLLISYYVPVFREERGKTFKKECLNFHVK